MTALGQLCLLVALVGSGYAAFACIAGAARRGRGLDRTGALAALVGVVAITVVGEILSKALVTNDCRFAYVALYCDDLLPWYYSLSALWVGQAGSLLVWAWLLGVLALAYRFFPTGGPTELRRRAFGILMACLCFLVAAMVFGYDPMAPSVTAPAPDAGLSPLLEHPAMLIHPPIVFLGYAGTAIPFALAVAALIGGRSDGDWVRHARPWAMFAWTALGLGILLGAEWAYEELGWGGYWGWDPVENGSLMPWLTATALIHTMMAYRQRGVLKKTTLALAIATFALCNFAAFLTRSGLFSSLHAFSESPIGWLFLILMIVLIAGGVFLIAWRRTRLAAEQPIRGVWSREAVILIAGVGLLLLAAATLAGTLAAPLSKFLLGRTIVLGPAYYNDVLIPIGLLLLAATALAPLLRWGAAPTPGQKRMLAWCVGLGGIGAAAVAAAFGVRHPISLVVACLAAMAAAALGAALILDARRRETGRLGLGLIKALRHGRRQYAGFLAHLGFVCLAIGVTGSSLGTQKRDVKMRAGQTVRWAGRTIRYVGLRRRELPDKLVVQARLDVSRRDASPRRVLPAQHLHRRRNQWTTEVAIHSTWSGDLYTILRGADERGKASFTLIANPMMRWLWLSGWVIGAAAVVRLWPARCRSRSSGAGTPGHADPATRREKGSARSGSHTLRIDDRHGPRRSSGVAMPRNPVSE